MALNDTITEYTFGHDGKSMLVGSRGELMIIPVEVGVPVQVTRTSTAREWGATPFTKDKLVLISDAAGEQQIAAVPIDGSASPALVTSDREAWLFPPVASPNERWDCVRR